MATTWRGTGAITDDDLSRLRADPSAAGAMEVGAIVHVVRPLIADLLATFCFYAVYAASGSVGAATILATGLGLAQLGWVVARRRRVPPIQWASLLLVLIVGAVSLATGDARWVLYKASIVYLAIGGTMLRPGWLRRYVPPIALAYLPGAVVARFGHMWAALLIGTGLLGIVLTRSEPARAVALVMGAWAPASKIVLLAGQYVAGRAIVRRRVIAALRAGSPPAPDADR